VPDGSPPVPFTVGLWPPLRYTGAMRHSSPRPRDGRLRRLGHLVNEFLAEGGGRQRSVSGLCAEIWPQVVGPWYARGTRVIGLKDKELSVWCDSPALAQQLQLDQATVIERLNERLGGAFIISLRPASVGPDRRGSDLMKPLEVPPGPGPEDLAAVAVTPSDRDFITRAAADIAEPDLRTAYMATVERELRARKWKLLRGWRVCPDCDELHAENGTLCFVCRIQRERSGGR